MSHVKPESPDLPSGAMTDSATRVLKLQHVLVAYAFGLLRDWALAEDIVQETVLLVVRRPELYDETRPLLPWVRGIVRNKCLNLVRLRQREVQDEALVFASLVDESLEDFWGERAAEEFSRRLAALRFCMEKLPQNACRLLYDFYGSGEAGKTLAEREGIGFSNLRSQLHRLRKRLRECVQLRLSEKETNETSSVWDLADAAFYSPQPETSAHLAEWLRGKPGRQTALGYYLLVEGAMRVATLQLFNLRVLDATGGCEDSAATAAVSLQASSEFTEAPCGNVITAKRSNWLPWAVGIAAVLTISLATWWLTGSATPPIGRVIHVTGISWKDDAQEGSIPYSALKPGDLIYGGSRIHVGERSALQIQLLIHRGQLTLFDRTTLAVQKDKPGHFRLSNGGFRASFEKQRPDSPAVFETPHSIARVVGTEFTLALDASASRLEVSEGQVQLAALGNPFDISVRRHESATVGTNEKLRLERLGGDRLDHGLLAHWPLNEAQGDQSLDLRRRPSLRLDLEGATWTTGLTGSGMHFDGSSYAQAADEPQMDPRGPFTLSAWIRADGQRIRSGIISKYRHEADDLPSERSYALKLYHGAFEFLVSADGTAKGLRTIRGATQIPMHEWTHVAAVFEPGKYMRLYVNGKLDGHATERIPSRPASVRVPLWLGATYRLTDEESFFKGSLDEIRIYKRALTSAEIRTLASQGE